MSSPKLREYLTILTIRLAARRRDAYASGAIFLFSFIFFVALGLLGRLTDRDSFLSASLVVVFGIVFLMAWVRFTLIQSTIELIKHLPDSEGTETRVSLQKS